MPTTLLGLAILVALLGPGFCYTAGQERRYPAKPQTPFRDTVQIAAASIVFNAAALGVLWFLRGQYPHETPNIAKLVVDTHQYWVSHYILVASWAGGTFLFACLLAFIAGNILPPSAGKFQESSWWKMFQEYPDLRKWVGCELLDGSYISGELISYSPESDETENRELVLRDPQYRGPDMKHSQSLQAASTAVSARNMRFLMVRHAGAVESTEPDPFQVRFSKAWSVLTGKACVIEPIMSGRRIVRR
jgi:hypothetical protein